MKKRNIKNKIYEVHIPFPYCEVYVSVPAKSAKEAIKKVRQSPGDFRCIGEISSRRCVAIERGVEE